MGKRNFLPRDLLLANQWSSLLFTTYSLSLSCLEAIVVSALARSYRDLTVLADLAGYRSSLVDVGAIGVVRNYDVVPVKVFDGVFHPKIPGRRLDVEHFPKLSRFIETCQRASKLPDRSGSRLLHTVSEPLDSQLSRIASDLGGAIALTVVSPFFSSYHGVKRLAIALSCEQVSVAVPPMAPSIFDFEACRQGGLSVLPVVSDIFNDSRSLHAKLFDIHASAAKLSFQAAKMQLSRQFLAEILRPSLRVFSST